MEQRPAFKQRLKNGEPVFGIWCGIPSGTVANVIASAGFDFIIIDVEHGPAGFETAEEMVRAAHSEGVSSFVRIGQVNDEYILKALDIGAEGVLVAHVGTKEEVSKVVAASKYHPDGTRGFSPYTRAGGYGGGDIVEHARLQNDRTVAGVLVEGTTGITNFDDILSTPKLDLVYVGAYDLSQALGIPGQVGHPRVRQTMEMCMVKARAKGIAAGGFVAKNAADVQWMLGMGMQFITYLPDCALLHNACKSAVGEFRAAVKR